MAPFGTAQVIHQDNIPFLSTFESNYFSTFQELCSQFTLCYCCSQLLPADLPLSCSIQTTASVTMKQPRRVWIKTSRESPRTIPRLKWDKHNKTVYTLFGSSIILYATPCSRGDIVNGTSSQVNTLVKTLLKILMVSQYAKWLVEHLFVVIAEIHDIKPTTNKTKLY